jgi:glycosyltransferase involved in cell wall biosynthesis
MAQGACVRGQWLNVLLNLTNLVKGGALQVAVSFLANAVRDPDVVWAMALSGSVVDELGSLVMPADTVQCETFARSPASSRSGRRRLGRFARDVDPDAVFSLFGPAYVDFSCPHLMGFANAWVTHPTALAYSVLPRLARVRARLGREYRIRWAQRADAWVTETDYARTQMAASLEVEPARISVVKNSCGDHYLRYRSRVVSPPPAGAPLRILVLSAYYPHKNLEIIPWVARALEDKLRGRPFEFVLTIPSDSAPYRALKHKALRLGVTDRLASVGSVSVEAGPALYERCHMTFMPTLLETSSAVFPESMAMGLPIVTTDLPFNRDVCRDAAEYFVAMDPKAAAGAILRVLEDPRRWGGLVGSGKEVLKTLPTQEEKYEGYKVALQNLMAQYG